MRTVHCVRCVCVGVRLLDAGCLVGVCGDACVVVSAAVVGSGGRGCQAGLALCPARCVVGCARRFSIFIAIRTNQLLYPFSGPGGWNVRPMAAFCCVCSAPAAVTPPPREPVLVLFSRKGCVLGDPSIVFFYLSSRTHTRA
jgi:hypothetical protein